MRSLSLWSMVFRSLRYFGRTHAAVGLGIAAATAVIVGALVVGDSVRGSLRTLVIGRLANIECVLQSRTFFDPQLLAPAAASAAERGAIVVPAIVLPSANVEKRVDQELHRASQVQLVAAGEEFWKGLQPQDSPPQIKQLNEDEVAINAALARELTAQIGDTLTVRFSRVSGVPADNPLGNRDDASISLPRQKLVAILPDEGIGGVSFRSGQDVPRNIFCNPASIQDALETGSDVNAALVLTPDPAMHASQTDGLLCQELDDLLQPRLEDYGLQLDHHRLAFPPAEATSAENASAENASAENGQPTDVLYDYYQLSSQDLVLDSETSTAVIREVGMEATRMLTYLANTISKIDDLPSDRVTRRTAVDYKYETLGSDPTQSLPPVLDETEIYAQTAPRTARERLMGGPAPKVELLSRPVPYSIMLGVDAGSDLQLSRYTQVPLDVLRVPYCWINSWLAEQLSASPGDWLQIEFFEPETIEGIEVERQYRIMIAGIVPLTEPVEGFRRNRPAKYDEPPTIFNDPNLTPNVPGLTDKDSIASWDAPFELNNDIILPVDDQYYNNHRLTPKLYLPFREAAPNFGSRFGHATAIRFPVSRFPDEAQLRSKIEQALLSTRGLKGLAFLPVRENMLRAASGTTPFDMLFLSLSMFVIVAALLLVTLLFKLGIQQRASQLGVLAAQGYSAGRIRGLLLRELSVVAVIGALVGILLGLGYARLMIAGLESWWVGAITTAFLNFSFTWQSLLIGAAVGVAASLATLYVSLRRLSKQTPLNLLRGQAEEASGPTRTTHRVSLTIAAFLGLGAVGLILAGLGQTGMARAGSFFGSGMLLLIAGLLGVRQLIENGKALGHRSAQNNNLLTLAWRAISRNPIRSTLSLGLLSVASFLIASMGVFHVSANPRGYGGFNLLGSTAQPIYGNIGASAVRQEVLGQAAEALRNTTILPSRIRPGEDASCNNLFQVAQPTVLGISPRLRQMHDFSPTAVRFDWAASKQPANPWQPLDMAATGSEASPIPVVLDQNTAAWSLKQGASLDAIITLSYNGRTVHFQTVGLLSNSVLQGKLLIGEDNFKRLFPEISGYGYFLIRTGQEQDPQAVAATLENGWSDEGMDVVSSRETLQRLLGVQNTYISAFQSLGALGLLLGTFGLVAVQLRSVLERRQELALMQAVGFSKQRIARMLTLETIMLLGGGLLVGILAAAIALVPYVLETGPELSTLQPLLMLGVVLLAGFLAASIAVRAAMRQPVLTSLRGE